MVGWFGGFVGVGDADGLAWLVYGALVRFAVRGIRNPDRSEC